MDLEKRYVQEYVHKIRGVRGFFLSDERLISFTRHHPFNVEPNTVNSKVSSLRAYQPEDQFMDVDLTATILNCNLDPLLKSGDFVAVTNIIDAIGRRNYEHILEFASRYCSAHYPDHYPIWNHRSEMIVSGFSGRNLIPGHYKQFARYFYEVRKKLGMQELNFFEIDKLFWIHQKDLQSIISRSGYVNNKIYA